MGELLSCPFCGHDEIAWNEGDGKKSAPHYLECVACYGTMGGASRELALAFWNRRASPEVSEAEVERAARAIYEDQHPYQFNWDQATEAARKGAMNLARAALTAARGERAAASYSESPKDCQACVGAGRDPDHCGICGGSGTSPEFPECCRRLLDRINSAELAAVSILECSDWHRARAETAEADRGTLEHVREVLGVRNGESVVAVALRMVGDAERLDWLERVSKTSTAYMDGRHPWNLTGNLKLRDLRGPTLRAAIDSAREGEAT